MSQSGAIVAGVAAHAARHGLGFSAMLSLGEALDIGFPEALEHFAADPETAAILLYIESIADGARFIEAARQALPQSP